MCVCVHVRVCSCCHRVRACTSAVCVIVLPCADVAVHACAHLATDWARVCPGRLEVGCCGELELSLPHGSSPIAKVPGTQPHPCSDCSCKLTRADQQGFLWRMVEDGEEWFGQPSGHRAAPDGRVRAFMERFSPLLSVSRPRRPGAAIIHRRRNQRDGVTVETYGWIREGRIISSVRGCPIIHHRPA